MWYDQTGGGLWVFTPGGWRAGGGAALIADTVLAADAASIDFANIPQTFRHLQLLVQARGDTAAAAAGLQTQFNGDTAANYDDQYVQSAAAVATAARAAAQTSMRAGVISANTSVANAASANRIDLPNYAGTTFFKHVLGQSGDSAGAGLPVLENNASYWRSTAAIVSIKLFPSAGNFRAGSRATLLGLG
jgi:uncharacterized protein YukE